MCKENGKYYIIGEYPEIPEEFEVGIRWIGTILKSGGVRNFSTGTAGKDYLIPREGSFKKDTTGLIDINDIEGFNMLFQYKNKEIKMDFGKIQHFIYNSWNIYDGTTKESSLLFQSQVHFTNILYRYFLF